MTRISAAQALNLDAAVTNHARQQLISAIAQDPTIISDVFEQLSQRDSQPPKDEQRNSKLISAVEAARRLRVSRSKFYMIRRRYPELRPFYFEGVVSYRADQVDALIARICGRLPTEDKKP